MPAGSGAGTVPTAGSRGGLAVAGGAPDARRAADIVAGVNLAGGNTAGSEAPRAGRAPGARLLRAGAIAFAAVIVSWLIYAALSGPFGALNEVDLTVYKDGGLIVRHVAPYYSPGAYAPLYDWGGYSDLALKFTYTPFAAIAFAAASILPWAALSAVSVVGNVAALLAALWFTFRGLGYADRRVRLGATLLAAAVTFWLQPVVRTVYLGQVNLILMALILWDLTQPDATASGGRRWWKGAATGVAAGVKLVPLIFVPYLLLTRRFREAAATLAGFAVTVAVGFAVLPHDSSRWWLHGMFLADGNRAGFMGWAGNQSLRAIVTRFAGSVAAGQAPWIAAACVALVLGLTAAVLLDRAGYPLPALLATALTGLLVSPISWDHHWVWIAPAVAVTGHYALAAARARRAAHRGLAVRPRRLPARGVRRVARRAVGERAQPRQLLPRPAVGAAQHQPGQVRHPRRPAQLRGVPLARLPAAVGQRLHPGRGAAVVPAARTRLLARQEAAGGRGLTARAGRRHHSLMPSPSRPIP